MNNYDKKQG